MENNEVVVSKNFIENIIEKEMDLIKKSKNITPGAERVLTFKLNKVKFSLFPKEKFSKFLVNK